jgi:hypothetical protein
MLHANVFSKGKGKVNKQAEVDLKKVKNGEGTTLIIP